jgi:hypothetical protein
VQHPIQNLLNRSSCLTKSEWLFGLAILIFLVSFFLIAKKTSFQSLERLHQARQALPVPVINVEVNGCVKKPGTVQIQRGATIRSVLRKARIKSMADLTNIDLDKVLDESCIITIPAYEKIFVHIQGCVKENVLLELPAESRICDLKSRLALSPDADPAFFRRRKILKNNEIIQVPSKDEKKIVNH